MKQNIVVPNVVHVTFYRRFSDSNVISSYVFKISLSKLDPDLKFVHCLALMGMCVFSMRNLKLTNEEFSFSTSSKAIQP